MRDSSLAEEPSIVWFRTTIWWPVEQVPVVLEVVHPRKLTVLEWAVLRVMEAFENSPPPLEEVALELGIADSVFLTDTVRDVVRLRALEASDEGWAELADLSFTSRGRELFDKGQIEGEPAEHGVTLFFDALTDRDLQKPSVLRSNPSNPFPPDKGSFTEREGVGLDRTREIVRRFHPELVGRGGEVTKVTLRPDAALVEWLEMDLAFHLSEKGELELACPAATDDRLARLVDAEPGILFPTAHVTETWPSESVDHEADDYDRWWAAVRRTVPVHAVESHVLRILRGTTGVAYLHAGWCSNTKVLDAARELAHRGGVAFIVGGNTTSVELLGPRSRLGILASIAVEGPVAAALTDGKQGITVDRVRLRWGGVSVPVELAGTLRVDAASALRQRLRERVLDALPIALDGPVPEPRLSPDGDAERTAEERLRSPSIARAVARLASSGARDDFEACTRVAAHECPGPERVALLRRLAAVGMRFVQGLDASAALRPALAAWHALLKQVDGSGSCTRVLIDLAPDDGLDDLVVAVVEAIRDCRGLEQQVEAVLRLRELADQRWGRGRCEGVKAYQDLRDALVRSTDDVETATRIAIAERLMNPEQLLQWAEGEVARLPPPVDGRTLVAWTDGVLPFADLVGTLIREEASEHLRGLVAQSPAEEHPEFLRAGARVLGPASLLEVLVHPSMSPTEILVASMRIREAGLEQDGRAVAAHVARVLPDPDAVGTTRDLSDRVSWLQEKGATRPELRRLGQEWSEEVIAALPPPKGADALIWWLGELVPMVPLLREPSALASTQLSRFAQELRLAREHNTQLWHQVKAAWSELGQGEAKLSELLDSMSIVGRQPGSGSKRKKKKKKKRRRK